MLCDFATPIFWLLLESARLQPQRPWFKPGWGHTSYHSLAQQLCWSKTWLGMDFGFSVALPNSCIAHTQFGRWCVGLKMGPLSDVLIKWAPIFLRHGCNGRLVTDDGVWIYKAFSGFWYKKKFIV